MIFVQITGLHCVEYAQKNQSGFDEHLYPSGNRAVNSLTAIDSHDRQLINELLCSLVTSTIFVRC